MNESKKQESALEKVKLFFEHTDDNRVVVTKGQRTVKQPSRSTASRR